MIYMKWMKIEKAMAFSCWTGQASSFWALRKACCRSLLLIGCRFKCFWGSPHRPPGPGAMFGQRDRWAAFHSLYTLSSPHTLLYIHKLCNIKKKVFFYNVTLNSFVLLEAWMSEGLVIDALYVHLVALHLVSLHLGCTASPLCTASKLHWSNVLTFNCV